MTVPSEADIAWDGEFESLCEAHGLAYVYESDQEKYGSPSDVEDATKQCIASFDALWAHLSKMPEVRTIAKIRKLLEIEP